MGEVFVICVAVRVAVRVLQCVLQCVLWNGCIHTRTQIRGAAVVEGTHIYAQMEHTSRHKRDIYLHTNGPYICAQMEHISMHKWDIYLSTNCGIYIYAHIGGLMHK